VITIDVIKLEWESSIWRAFCPSTMLAFRGLEALIKKTLFQFVTLVRTSFNEKLLQRTWRHEWYTVYAAPPKTSRKMRHVDIEFPNALLDRSVISSRCNESNLLEHLSKTHGVRNGLS